MVRPVRRCPGNPVSRVKRKAVGGDSRETGLPIGAFIKGFDAGRSHRIQVDCIM